MSGGGRNPALSSQKSHNGVPNLPDQGRESERAYVWADVSGVDAKGNLEALGQESPGTPEHRDNNDNPQEAQDWRVRLGAAAKVGASEWAYRYRSHICGLFVCRERKSSAVRTVDTRD